MSIFCETPEDVSGAISFARRHGMRLAPRSGGHCFAGRSSTEGIVVDVSPMRSVSVSGGVAMVGAGARLGGVYDALDEHGLTIPAGCGPSVGIAGLALGGGLGILGRKHGLTSDSLLGAQVVLADGGIVECDEDHEPDLFWALRGAGGGNFGVVTFLVFETIPAPDVTSFHLTWPHARETEDARRWLGRSWGLARPWGSGGVYPNWPDPDLKGWARAYHSGNLGRLMRVKARYDPEGFFRFHQSVPGRLPRGGTPA